MARAEARELYVYAMDHFENDLNKISKDCVAPLMAVRQVVKKAIIKYCNDYTNLRITQAEDQDVFTDEDFQEVSKQIFNELMNN